MSTPDEPKQRLRSLDVLRGFDMFWIIGGSGFFLALLKWLSVPDSTIEAFATQFTHVEWEGFRFFDLIFPLFVFLSGVSIPYAILSRLNKGVSKARLQLKIIRRSVILILLGLSFSIFKFEPDNIRLYTVLWLIGVAYLIGSSISLHVKKWQTQAIIVFVVLLSYHLALVFLPYPGKAAEITASNNLAAWLDCNLIQTSLYRGNYDPEGTIRVIPAGMLCLLGALAGQRIKHYKQAKARCSLELTAAGLCCLLMGWIWSFVFPIIKDLWSPSFILWAAGLSLLLLAFFYLVIDVWKQVWLGWFFLPIGMNAISIYVGQRYFTLHLTRDFFFLGWAKQCNSVVTQQLILTTGYLAVVWFLLYYLYKRKIFIRV